MPSECVVLLVEDEPLIRDIVETVLDSGGYGVVAVPSGTAAMTAFAADPGKFGALVTDIQLESHPNGWVLADAVRELAPSLPVLYMSGGSAHEWPTRGAARSLMLAKPFGPMEVLSSLSKLLGGGGPPSALH